MSQTDAERSFFDPSFALNSGYTNIRKANGKERVELKIKMIKIKVVSVHAMKEEKRCSSTSTQPQYLVELSGQPHALTASSS
jgi:mRNA degradation ribonuclease J1/J2